MAEAHPVEVALARGGGENEAGISDDKADAEEVEVGPGER